jgi:F0F1-type ATP synthase assembly protein I
VIPRDTIQQYTDSQNLVQDVARGIVGAGSSILGLLVSNIETIEAWLRITSLLVGIAVGIATLWQIFRRKR